MNWIIDKILGFTGSQKFLSVQLDITNSCNLNCRHCYQGKHSAGEDLPFTKWVEILGQYGKLAEKLHLKPNFCLSGGEPTRSLIFPDILREIKSRWPDAGVIVLTNATDISGENIEQLARNNVDVQISIDGPDSERHDFIRGVGNFERAMTGMRALRSVGITPTFQAVLSHRTASWINDFFVVAGEMKAAAMNFTRFIAQGKGRELNVAGIDRPLEGEALRKAYAAIISSSSKTGTRTNTNLPLMVLLSPELGANGKFGFQGVMIDYLGNLKVSSRSDFLLGNIFNEGLESLFINNQLMKDLRDGKIEGCGECGFYDRCGGDRNASYAAYGNFFKKDPGCWLQI